MTAKMDKPTVQEACRQSLRSALGGPGTDIALARYRNLEYYNAQPEGDLAPPEIDDRSDFVATDVADTIEWMLPQIMRMFVSSDNAVEFEARSPQAEPIAKLATAYVNYLFYTRNDGVGVMYDWFKDALIQKVGFVKVWAEEDYEDAQQTYEGQTEEQLVMLQQDGWTLTDDPKVDEQGGLTFTVKQSSKKIAFKVAACAPHEVRVDSNARWGDDPAMIAHVYRKRKFELEEEGYDLSGIGQSAGDARYDSEVLQMLGETADNLLAEPHASHELYQCAEIYIKLDADGDGIAEWLCCHMIEDELMDYEKCDGHPFVWICPIPRPHAFFGDCPADFAIQPQKLRTSVVRSIEDNLTMAVNNRLYVNTEAGVNLDDILENRPNGIIRGRGPANSAIQPLEQPNLGAPAYEFNEWLESWRENRTGFTRYSQGADANALNKTATGVSIITQKSDQRMELIARFFAVGVKQLFAKMLKLAIQHQNKADMIKLGEQWVPINPSEWREQFDVNIKVGLGTGSKEQQAARIMGLMQAMQLGVPMGICSPQNFAEAIRLYVEANEFKNPERFVSPQPSGMPPNPQAYQQEKQLAMQQMGKLQQQLESTTQENAALKSSQAVKQMGLEQQAQIADQKHQHAMATISLKAAEFQQKGEHMAHDHVIQAAQADQQVSAVNQEQGEGAQISELQQKVDQLNQMVQSIVQAIQQGQPQGQGQPQQPQGQQ